MGYYHMQMKDVFAQPHGRKGLLMGGVIWRWAREFSVSIDDALGGPSPDCIKNNPVCSRLGTDYFDDMLSDSEIDTILGVY